MFELLGFILSIWRGIKLVRDKLEKFFREYIPFWLIVLTLGSGWLLITMWLVWGKLDEMGNTVDQIGNNVDQITLTIGALGALFVGIVGLVGLYVNYGRTKAFEDSTDKQRESDERRDYQHLYASSIKYLEHDKESVKLGAVYGLIRLAKNSRLSGDPWTSDVADILRAHIDSITKDSRENRVKPSSYASTVLRLFIPHKNDTLETNPFLALPIDLNDFYLVGVNLNGLHMKDANLTKVDLSGADLRGVNLTGANLMDVNLSGADLRGVNLTGANLMDVNLSGANLRRADLRRVDLRRVDLSGADLSAADLRGADLTDADLTGVDLSGANLRDTNLTDADLSGANYTSEDLRGAILDRNKPLAGGIGYTDEELT